jgi:hypothetical protein
LDLLYGTDKSQPPLGVYKSYPASAKGQRQLTMAALWQGFCVWPILLRQDPAKPKQSVKQKAGCEGITDPFTQNI